MRRKWENDVEWVIHIKGKEGIMLETSHSFISDTLLSKALELQASDVHLIPNQHGYDVHFRMVGTLTFVYTMNTDEAKKILNHLKYIVGMDISDRRQSQSKAFEYMWNEQPIAMRISTLPTTPLESIAIRILNSSSIVPLQSLSPFLKDTHHFNQLLSALPGLFLVTGSTGSGKTTTIYSFVKQLVQIGGFRIISVEDPVEHRLQGITQVEIQSRGGLTFERALRAILRHDPDVIVIGEIRDKETAALAVQAAITGHFVIASLHVTNSALTIDRLRDLGIGGNLSCLQAIVYQKLIAQKGADQRLAVFDWLLAHQLKEVGEGKRKPRPFLKKAAKAWAVGILDDDACIRLSRVE